MVDAGGDVVELAVVGEVAVVDVRRCLGWNSVMMTVTLLTVTALC